MLTLDYKEYLDLEETKELVEELRAGVRLEQVDDFRYELPTIVVSLPRETLFKLLRLQEAEHYNHELRFGGKSNGKCVL